jgi:hypothetical protein
MQSAPDQDVDGFRWPVRLATLMVADGASTHRLRQSGLLREWLI